MVYTGNFYTHINLFDEEQRQRFRQTMDSQIETYQKQRKLLRTSTIIQEEGVSKTIPMTDFDRVDTTERKNEFILRHNSQNRNLDRKITFRYEVGDEKPEWTGLPKSMGFFIS